MTPDEILQALRNQRFWLHPETLDADLTNAIELIEQLMTEMAAHRAGWLEVLTLLGEINND